MIDWESPGCDEEIAALVHGGADGERRLLAALETAPEEWRPTVVAALGEASGPAGADLLQRLVADPAADGDSRCAGVLALAKRRGVAASSVLADCLYDQDDAVREYALIALSCVGDDRAVDHVHALLEIELARAAPPANLLAIQSLVPPLATYLVRHAKSRRQANELADLVRRGLAVLSRSEVEWLTVYWPDAVSDVDSGIRPVGADMVAWQRLLSPLYPRAA